jgi:4-hydroxybenzoate polyprenyltransferase
VKQARLVATMLRYRVASLLLPFFLLAPALHDHLREFSWRYVAGLLALFGSYVVATSLNDVFDLDIDRINRW